MNYVIPQNMLILVLELSIAVKKYLDKTSLGKEELVLAHNSVLRSFIARQGSQGSHQLIQLVT